MGAAAGDGNAGAGDGGHAAVNDALGAAVGDGAEAAGGVNEAENLDELIWWGCRPCKLKEGLYRRGFTISHEKNDQKREEAMREARNREAQRRQEAEAGAHRRNKNWVDKYDRRSRKR
jgi:hypothetical protein